MKLYLLSFGAINVVDYFLCLYNFIRSLVVLFSPKSDRWHCRKQVALSALTCRFSPFALWGLADFG